MKKIAFFDTKPYDKKGFDDLKEQNDFNIKYIEYRLNPDTAYMAKGCDAVCAFVNDVISKETIDILSELGIKIIALRCAGYNNVDFEAALNKVHVVTVPAYSPHAVAEHAMALLLAVNRKLHRATHRTRDFNFSLNGLTGFDLFGKTIGVIGTGKIGQIFIEICKGFGMNVLAYDPYPAKIDVQYVGLDELFSKSDIISLHCPLTKDTYHIINEESIGKMKDNVYLINTSRGALIDSEALLKNLKSGKIGGAALDVYEEESEVFFEDFSNEIIRDDTLAMLISLPNVIITSHQAFLTEEALNEIAKVTIENLNEYFNSQPLKNEICYRCNKANCEKKANGRCF
ncbi:MAG: 2-hydroxyacid dehydrogenase [Bacillota bacterium]|nr:2-hydroxyacid dehydrogenase [Bacillota bacterium]